MPSVVEREKRLRLHQEQTDAALSKIQEALSQQNTVNNELMSILKAGDSKLESLSRLLGRVEHYQPLYGLGGVIKSPARAESKNRAETIAKALEPLSGRRILDIGSSLGYFSFYLADRGAITEGWESNADNCEVARIVQQINGVDAVFKTKELNEETVSSITPNQFDATLVLSVFHHIIRFNGLAYTQRLVKELLDRSPIMIVELARKGEDTKLAWDKSQPKDELEIFKLVKDEITIEKIGDFSTHLSKKTRPLYIVQKTKKVTVAGKAYEYNTVSGEAYAGSGALPQVFRRYYFGDQAVIKEYHFDNASREENEGQILREISALTTLNDKGIHKLPKLLAYDINSQGYTRLAVARSKGMLLSDMEERFDAATTVEILTDLSKTLADLEDRHLYHNDIRSWNIIVDKKSGTLIDYGLVDSKDTDQNANAFLWVAHKMLTGKREGFEQAKKTVPAKEVFEESEKLKAVYELIASSRTPSFRKIHAILAK